MSISRRKLLGSIGMTGAAIAASGFIGAAAEPGGSRVLAGALAGMDCVEPTTMAVLRANTLADSDVYLIVDAGHAGHFKYDSTDTTSADNTGSVLVTASGKRYKRLVETEFVNVKWFGAKGDGTTDDSAAVQAADAYAAAIHGALLFPYGTYRGSGLTPTASWLSFENAIIQSNATVPMSTFNGSFVRVENQSELLFEGLTFDGNVSADPVSWSTSTYNAFSGSVGLFLLNSSRIRLRNCLFQNSFFSTIRLTACQDIDIESCTMRKARGNFGDGAYVEQSYNVRFDRCRAEDYTRIGFVTELGTSHVHYSQCYAANGHDGSKLYGGTEFNAGFWSEQSENIGFSQCIAENNAHRGFVCVTLFAPTVVKRTEVAAFMLDSCIAINNTQYAFAFNGANNHVISVSCSSCHAYDSYISYHISGTDRKDTFRFVNCTAHLSFADPAKTYTGFVVNNEAANPLTESAIHILNCGTVLGEGDWSSLADKGSLSADIAVYNGAKAILTVDRYTNAETPGHTVLKSFAGSPTLHIRDCELSIPVVRDFSELRFEGCRFGSMTHDIGITSAQGNVSLNDCSLNGPLRVITNGRVNVRDCSITLTGTQALRIVRGTSSNDMMTEFHGCRFEKDVSADDYAVHLYETGAEKPKAVFIGCTFYQPNVTPTSTKSFIWLEFVGTKALFEACYADSLVSTPLKTGTVLSAPAGITLVSLH